MADPLASRSRSSGDVDQAAQLLPLGGIHAHGFNWSLNGDPPAAKERQQRRDRSRRPGWQRYDAEHRLVRDIVLAEEDRCWLCHDPEMNATPLKVDHVVPNCRRDG